MDQTHALESPALAGRFLTTSDTWEACLDTRIIFIWTMNIDCWSQTLTKKNNLQRYFYISEKWLLISPRKKKSENKLKYLFSTLNKRISNWNWIRKVIFKDTLKETGIPDHLTCLLRNLYAGQEATVRTGLGTTDWFQNGEGVHQGCILSPCLFNLYAEYIMRNVRLDEALAGNKIDRRNINNLICR